MYDDPGSSTLLEALCFIATHKRYRHVRLREYWRDNWTDEIGMQIVELKKGPMHVTSRKPRLPVVH